MHRQRDALEDIELNKLTSTEDFPTSQEGFRRHPLYCLEKFISKYQIIYPRKAIGDFKGQPVFLRSCIREVHTPIASSWPQSSTLPKDGCNRADPSRWMSSLSKESRRERRKTYGVRNLPPSKCQQKKKRTACWRKPISMVNGKQSHMYHQLHRRSTLLRDFWVG